LRDLFKQFQREDFVLLGDKRAKVRKLTFEDWEQLDDVLANLPGLILRVAAAPKDEFQEYVFEAISIAREDVLHVVSGISGIDYDYLKKHAGVTEVIEYFAKTAKKNDFAGAVKNAKSLLPKNKAE
jgi:hypothetical protein